MRSEVRGLLQRLRRGAGAPPLLGVDLGNASVRLVELGGSRERPVLECLACEPLDKGRMNDGQVEDFDAVAEALRRVVQRSGTRTRRAALALPAASVITQKFTVPAGLGEAALEQQVMCEARQHLPFAADEMSLDFCVLGPAAAGAMEVLVAASRLDRVQDRQGLAEAAGLEPVVLDVESHAAHRALARIAASVPQAAEAQEDAPDEPGTVVPVALFEIGTFSTTLKLLSAEAVLYERDQPVGGAQLTRLIARQCSVGFDAAEQMKLAGTLSEALAPALLAEFVDGLAQELARALQIGFASSPWHRVRAVMLAGASAALPGLPQRVAQLTGFATRLADPFDGMALAAAVPAARLPREAPGYLKACGLALRRFSPLIHP
jgi:type IV pilus assembly protein PilM